MLNKTLAVMYVEFYREDGSWIGSAAVGAELNGEFTRAARVVFEGRIEIVTFDQDGNLID